MLRCPVWQQKVERRDDMPVRTFKETAVPKKVEKKEEVIVEKKEKKSS